MGCLELIGLTTSSIHHRMVPDVLLDREKALQLANCLKGNSEKWKVVIYPCLDLVT